MDLFKETLALINEASGFTQAKNYYFERHQCAVSGNEEKIYMDYNLHKENYKQGMIDYIRFGSCPHCKQVYYHVDFKKQVIVR